MFSFSHPQAIGMLGRGVCLLLGGRGTPALRPRRPPLPLLLRAASGRATQARLPPSAPPCPLAGSVAKLRAAARSTAHSRCRLRAKRAAAQHGAGGCEVRASLDDVRVIVIHPSQLPKWSAPCQENRVFLGWHAQLAGERVAPGLLLVVPIGDHRARSGTSK